MAVPCGAFAERCFRTDEPTRLLVEDRLFNEQLVPLIRELVARVDETCLRRMYLTGGVATYLTGQTTTFQKLNLLCDFRPRFLRLIPRMYPSSNAIAYREDIIPVNTFVRIIKAKMLDLPLNPNIRCMFGVLPPDFPHTTTTTTRLFVSQTNEILIPFSATRCWPVDRSRPSTSLASPSTRPRAPASFATPICSPARARVCGTI